MKNYTIFLRDKSQTEISENDYNNISKFLGKLKLFKLENGQIINAVDISKIVPVNRQEIISKEFRVEGPEEKEERVKVIGGWQRPSVRKEMKKMFIRFKEKGCFREFETYENWESKAYNS